MRKTKREEKRFEGALELQETIAALVAAPSDSFTELATIGHLDLAKDLRGADLSGMDLGEANLEGTDLREVNLSGARLWRANLRYCNLARADLTRADLTEADLSDAFLVGADASDADFDGATLRNADLRQTRWNGANFSGAHIDGMIADGPPPGFELSPPGEQPLPSDAAVEIRSLSSTYGRFFAGPFERGFGATIGIALRRCLLSSIEGAALAAVKIEGVEHEFATLPGVIEDVTDIILNLKRVPIRMHSRAPRVITLEAKGPGEVTAAHFAEDPNIEILDNAAHIATTRDTGRIKLQALVKQGRGYVTADRNFDESMGLGWIALDSVHSPVRSVNYRLEPVPLDESTPGERLVLEVITNGAIGPESALSSAAQQLSGHLRLFGDAAMRSSHEEAARDEYQSSLETLLARPIEELDLTVRSFNALRNANIHTLRDLVQRNRQDLLATENVREKVLDEVTAVLGTLGLELDMHLSRGAVEVESHWDERAILESAARLVWE